MFRGVCFVSLHARMDLQLFFFMDALYNLDAQLRPDSQLPRLMISRTVVYSISRAEFQNQHAEIMNCMHDRLIAQLLLPSTCLTR